MQLLKARNSFEQTLESRLQKRRELGSFRTLTVASGRVDFTSNDYLGLGRSVELASRVEQKLNAHREPARSLNGSTGSRLLSGNSSWAEALERKLAEFHQTEAALLFNCGYDANLGALASLLSMGDTVFYDELCHASMHDGMRLGKAKACSFRHNDCEHLRGQLSNMPNPTDGSSVMWIVVESLYSMDGDVAPLEELAQLAREFEARLFVDEAHATGVFGPSGAGLVQELDLVSEVAVRVHTFGK